MGVSKFFTAVKARIIATRILFGYEKAFYDLLFVSPSFLTGKQPMSIYDSSTNQYT
jgi:hypothetical protein